MSILKVNTILDKGGNTLLSSDGAGTISSGGAITNTPAFLAYSNTTTTTSTNTWTLCKMDTKVFDTNTCFDVSTYTFTPTVAGKYYLYASVRFGNTIDFDQIAMRIYKNGGTLSRDSSATRYQDVYKTMIVSEANGTTDYFDVRVYQNSGGTENFSSGEEQTYFGAYKLIGA